jgi:hypothetical protein
MRWLCIARQITTSTMHAHPYVATIPLN